MIQQYLEYAQLVQGKAINTVKAYGQDLRNFARYAGDNIHTPRWSTMTREDIQTYVIWMRRHGNSAKTTNRHLSSLKGFYDFLISQNLLKSENPVRYMQRAKTVQNLPNTLPLDDLRAAIRHTSGKLRLQLMILTETGIRLQELLDIDCRDVNFFARTLKIHGKGNKERTIYLSQETIQYIIRECPTRKGKLFPMANQRNVRYQIWATLIQYSSARQLSPHAIRHTYATEVAKKGMTATTLQRLMGHEHLETTQRYIDYAQVDTEKKARELAPQI